MSEEHDGSCQVPRGYLRESAACLGASNGSIADEERNRAQYTSVADPSVFPTREVHRGQLPVRDCRYDPVRPKRSLTPGVLFNIM